MRHGPTPQVAEAVRGQWKHWAARDWEMLEEHHAELPWPPAILILLEDTFSCCFQSRKGLPQPLCRLSLEDCGPRICHLVPFCGGSSSNGMKGLVWH